MKVLFVLLVIVLLALEGPAVALSKAEEHPVIKSIPGFQLVLAQSRTKNYASHQFRVKKGKKAERVEKKGKYWQLKYVIKDAKGKIDRSVSREEIVQNYKAAALEKGGDILYEVGYLLTFTLTREDGGKTWSFLSAGDGYYNLYIIDEAAFKKQLTFDAEEMKKVLDEEGHVAIYGINFDIDRAVLKLGAEKVLIEMVKLMKNNPDLKIEIQGHTDNTGSADHNLDLSTRRADTVRKFLLLYGIEAPRMVSKGYGEEKPVASNDTEEGRAKNRRVELINLN